MNTTNIQIVAPKNTKPAELVDALACAMIGDEHGALVFKQTTLGMDLATIAAEASFFGFDVTLA